MNEKLLKKKKPNNLKIEHECDWEIVTFLDNVANVKNDLLSQILFNDFQYFHFKIPSIC